MKTKFSTIVSLLQTYSTKYIFVLFIFIQNGEGDGIIVTLIPWVYNKTVKGD